MSWRTEWAAISNRILGLLESGEFLMRSFSVRSSDPYGAASAHVIPEAREIIVSIRAFRQTFGESLGSRAVAALDRIVARGGSIVDTPAPDAFHAVQYIVSALTAFRAEFGYLTADVAALARRLSERAFVHLQRSIVADSGIRTAWQNAFEEGETSCEKLGAAHLLLHGIWAFKVGGAGERTDLFGEPLRDLTQPEAAADALVLTEWKLVRNPEELQTQLVQARRQASRYVAGILGGIELASYRYLVIVSRDRSSMPADSSEEGIVYRNVNIAVDPLPPSRRSIGQR
jgi:hypothetical protein